MGAWNKGKTKEDFPNLSKSGVKPGSIPWNKGKSGYKTSGKKKGVRDNTGRTHFKKGQVPWNKGLTYSLSEEWKQNISKALKGRIGAMTGKKHTDAWKEQHKLFMENQPIEFYRKCLEKRKMSGLEKRVAEIIRQNDLPYKFVGNGEFFIERKNPDFINTNGKKIAIEVYYKRHKEQIRNMTEAKWKQERIETFKKYGWKTLFLEGTKLTNKDIVAALTKGEI